MGWICCMEEMLWRGVASGGGIVDWKALMAQKELACSQEGEWLTLLSIWVVGGKVGTSRWGWGLELDSEGLKRQVSELIKNPRIGRVYIKNRSVVASALLSTLIQKSKHGIFWLNLQHVTAVVAQPVHSVPRTELQHGAGSANAALKCTPRGHSLLPLHRFPWLQSILLVHRD